MKNITKTLFNKKALLLGAAFLAQETSAKAVRMDIQVLAKSEHLLNKEFYIPLNMGGDLFFSVYTDFDFPVQGGVFVSAGATHGTRGISLQALAGAGVRFQAGFFGIALSYVGFGMDWGRTNAYEAGRGKVEESGVRGQDDYVAAREAVAAKYNFENAFEHGMMVKMDFDLGGSTTLSVAGAMLVNGKAWFFKPSNKPLVKISLGLGKKILA